MFKAILDHRFAAEYRTLRENRTQLVEVIAQDVARNRPSGIAARWVTLTGGPLQDTPHPLLSNKLTPEDRYPLPSSADFATLQPETQELVQIFFDKCIAHIKQRNAVKSLLAELENVTRSENTLKGWALGQEIIGGRPRAEIIIDLDRLVRNE